MGRSLPLWHVLASSSEGCCWTKPFRENRSLLRSAVTSAAPRGESKSRYPLQGHIDAEDAVARGPVKTRMWGHPKMKRPPYAAGLNDG